MGHKSDAEAMSELTSLMWSRYLKEQVRGELNHEMNAYKAEVVTNHGDGTLTVQRPFETVQLRLKAAPSLAYAQAGDMVLVVGIGDKSKALSNAFILCKADLSDDSSVPSFGLGQNLLRNAYFVGGGTGRGVFPINPSGITTYTTSGYHLPGWYSRQAFTINLQSDGMALTFANSSSAKGLNQPLYMFREYLAGKMATVSVLVKDFNLTVVQGESVTYPLYGLFRATSAGTNSLMVLGGTLNGNGLFTATGVIPSTILTQSALNFSPCFPYNVSYGSVTIVAAKLELGTQQTLAHMENGAWVLNEQPDYAVEEARCLYAYYSGDDPLENFNPSTAEMLGPVETGATASQAYAIGDYFCWCGRLYKATKAISSGASISPGTGSSNNCVQTTVAAELIALR